MKETPIQKKLSAADSAELQKCKESPLYFYNKYVKNEGKRELTQEEFNRYKEGFELLKNRPLLRLFKFRNPNYPYTWKESFSIVNEGEE